MAKRNINILLGNYAAMSGIDTEDKVLRYLVDRQTQYFIFRRIYELAENNNALTGEKWFDFEIDSEQILLKALTTNFITRNFGSRRLAIKESHQYKQSNVSRKVRIFR